MIKIVQKGSFDNLEAFLERNKQIRIDHILQFYAEQGVEALRAATPRDTGATAESWGYEITKDATGYHIYWTNSNENKGAIIALLLQFGHGTGTGGYVQGIDYINPALKPIFDDLADRAWKEVTK